MNAYSGPTMNVAGSGIVTINGPIATNLEASGNSLVNINAATTGTNQFTANDNAIIRINANFFTSIVYGSTTASFRITGGLFQALSTTNILGSVEIGGSAVVDSQFTFGSQAYVHYTLHTTHYTLTDGLSLLVQPLRIS